MLASDQHRLMNIASVPSMKKPGRSPSPLLAAATPSRIAQSPTTHVISPPMSPIRIRV